jgi:hypothetical protein
LWAGFTTPSTKLGGLITVPGSAPEVNRKNSKDAISKIPEARVKKNQGARSQPATSPPAARRHRTICRPIQ